MYATKWITSLKEQHITKAALGKWGGIWKADRVRTILWNAILKCWNENFVFVILLHFQKQKVPRQFFEKVYCTKKKWIQKNNNDKTDKTDGKSEDYKRKIPTVSSSSDVENSIVEEKTSDKQKKK